MELLSELLPPSTPTDTDHCHMQFAGALSLKPEWAWEEADMEEEAESAATVGRRVPGHQDATGPVSNPAPLQKTRWVRAMGA